VGELEPAEDAGKTFELQRDRDGVAVVRIAGELDMNNVDELAAAVDPIVSGRPERLVVDISGVRFADSSAIALWVKWANVVRRLELRDPSPLLRRVITRMGLAQRLRMSP
jgi:anti-anti-sigma factor